MLGPGTVVSGFDSAKSWGRIRNTVFYTLGQGGPLYFPVLKNLMYSILWFLKIRTRDRCKRLSFCS